MLLSEGVSSKASDDAGKAALFSTSGDRPADGNEDETSVKGDEITECQTGEGSGSDEITADLSPLRLLLRV